MGQLDSLGADDDFGASSSPSSRDAAGVVYTSVPLTVSSRACDCEVSHFRVGTVTTSRLVCERRLRGAFVALFASDLFVAQTHILMFANVGTTRVLNEQTPSCFYVWVGPVEDLDKSPGRREKRGGGHTETRGRTRGVASSMASGARTTRGSRPPRETVSYARFITELAKAVVSRRTTVTASGGLYLFRLAFVWIDCR